MSRVRCVSSAEYGATTDKLQLTVDASTRANACMSKSDPNTDLTQGPGSRRIPDMGPTKRF